MMQRRLLHSSTEARKLEIVVFVTVGSAEEFALRLLGTRCHESAVFQQNAFTPDRTGWGFASDLEDGICCIERACEHLPPRCLESQALLKLKRAHG